MAIVSTAWGRRIDELLADGEWHDVDELLREAARTVPPGMAYRRGESMRTRRPAPAQRVRGDRAVAVAAGARSIASDAVRQRTRFGTAVRDGGRIRRQP